MQSRSYRFLPVCLAIYSNSIVIFVFLRVNLHIIEFQYEDKITTFNFSNSTTT